MTPARIAELLAPFLGETHEQQLTSEDLDHISTYIDILLRWNSRINLTAIRDPEEIVTRHFGESLFAARILFPVRELKKEQGAPLPAGFARSGSSADKLTLADIGSGAGFPGIPIKLWHPRLSITMIESNHRKSTFLREIARALTLTDINILAARAESLAATAFDIVTLRAVERFEATLPIAARLLAPAGRLALLIGKSQLPLAQSTLSLIPGFGGQDITGQPIPMSRSRVLVVVGRSVSP